MPEKAHDSSSSDDLLRYYALVDSMNDAFGVVDVNQIFIYVNKRFGELLHYSVEEIIGKKITEFFDDKNRKVLFENIEKRKEGQASQYEIEWTRSDGIKVPTIVSGAPLVGKDGKHRGSYAVVTDISDIKAATEALEASEQLYRSVIEALNEGLLLLNPDYTIKYVNPSFVKILGYAESELLGHSVVEFLHDDIKQESSAWIAERRTKFTKTYELPWRSKGGERIYTFTTPKGIYDSAGKLSGIIGVMVDISAIKEAEEALKASEERYKILFHESPIGVITASIDGSIAGINRLGLEIIGSTSKEETMKINVLEFPALADIGIPDALNEVVETKEIVEGEAIYSSSGGKEIVLRYKIAPLLGNGGNVEQFLITFDDITEVKKAEQARKQSEENYRTLAEKSLQGLCVIQHDKYAYVNPAFAEIVGYTPGEILAMEPEEAWNLVYHDDKKYLLKLAAKRRAGELTPSPYEYRLVRRDGTVRWVEAFSSIIKFGGDEATQVHVIDITDRKITEMKLRTSQEMLELVMNNIPQFVFWKDTASLYLGCNENYARAAGLRDPSEIIGKSDFDLAWRHDEAELFHESDKKVIETKQPLYDIIERQLRANGREAWLRTTKVPLLDQNDNIIGILGTQEDVTDSLEAQEAIRKSETKYRTLAEQSIQGITIVTNDGFGYVNKSFAEMTGRSVEDLLKLEEEKIWEIFHPEDRPVLNELIKARREKKPIPPRNEYRIIRKDGSFRWLEAYAQTIEFQGESAIQTIWVDITDRRQAEREIRTEKDRATLYLDLMGHDIRQQLQVIMNSATLLKSAAEEEVRNSFFGIIEEAVQRCSRLIEEVRATEYLMSLPMSKKSILFAVQGCIQAMAPYSAQTEFHLDSKVSDAIVSADEFLELLITNILMNAIEHNKKAQKNVWIEILEDETGYIIAVSDDGPGIGNKRKTELFDMARRYGGVGLHQSNQIIEKYGGKITVMDRIEGAPSKGARFEMWFPKIVNNTL